MQSSLSSEDQALSSVRRTYIFAVCLYCAHYGGTHHFFPPHFGTLYVSPLKFWNRCKKCRRLDFLVFAQFCAKSQLDAHWGLRVDVQWGVLSGCFLLPWLASPPPLHLTNNHGQHFPQVFDIRGVWKLGFRIMFCPRSVFSPCCYGAQCVFSLVSLV